MDQSQPVQPGIPSVHPSLPVPSNQMQAMGNKRSLWWIIYWLVLGLVIIFGSVFLIHRYSLTKSIYLPTKIDGWLSNFDPILNKLKN